LAIPQSLVLRAYSFAETTFGAVRTFQYHFVGQPRGWLEGTVKVDWPIPWAARHLW
jgi:hypothetical protein